MSSTTTGSVTAPEGGDPEVRQQAVAGNVPEPRVYDALHTELGDTTITVQVVEKIAAMAAREIPGVYSMGSAVGRAMSSLGHRLSGQQPSVTSGVSVEKGERQTAIDISIIVEYGAAIVDVANSIREAIISSVEYATGLEVVSVDVIVSDVHLPDEDDDTQAGTATTSSSELQ